jgi:hypothetical protein
LRKHNISLISSDEASGKTLIAFVLVTFINDESNVKPFRIPRRISPSEIVPINE